MWKKHGTARQTTDKNMRDWKDAICLRQGYGHTLIIFHTYCFSTVKIGLEKASQCYVIHTLPTLFFFTLWSVEDLKQKSIMSGMDVLYLGVHIQLINYKSCAAMKFQSTAYSSWRPFHNIARGDHPIPEDSHLQSGHSRPPHKVVINKVSSYFLLSIETSFTSYVGPNRQFISA
jgi:hypothetical protein